ncbi:hypothetical protein RF11_13646 [Thelohanellus kitauei]|uniref:ISXO2-like transposase domain-containing protein n=1 Tax=Thelohanellus kitauei TaxID=669202 RepID=A0A0C2JF56_THEKT|nr:hypothetical protein RF11_13646 [Thelohanellus kitauei]
MRTNDHIRCAQYLASLISKCENLFDIAKGCKPEHEAENSGDKIVESSILYLLEEETVIQPDHFPNSNNSRIKRRNQQWRCTKNYRKECSVFTDYCFEQSRIPLNESPKTRHNYGFKPITLTRQMNELKSTKQKWENKYNRGHLVMGAWVLGKDFKTFLVEVSDRTAETLVMIISNRVLPGFTIITDGFRSYVNYSLINFTDPSNGAHTNTIDGSGNALKIKISPWNQTNSYDEDGNVVKNHLDDLNGEFLWRRKHSNDGLLIAIKKIIFTHE